MYTYAFIYVYILLNVKIERPIVYKIGKNFKNILNVWSIRDE